MKIVNLEELEFPEPRHPKVEVVRFRPDFENPGQFPRQETKRITSEGLPGYWYLNPATRVACAEESDEFVVAVMKAQASWFRILSRQFKSGWRRLRQQADSWTEAFEFDGVVVREGSVVPVKVWRHFFKHTDASP
jgi:hypothetical protein